MEQRRASVREENEELLREEERLKGDIEEMRGNLEEYKRITRREIEESEAMKREQKKHKGKIDALKKMVTDTVLNQGRKKNKKKESYIAPTIASVMRDQKLMEFRPDPLQEVLEPHLAKPPLFKHPRSKSNT